MGAWGTGIFQNDSASDIRDIYRSLLEQKVPDTEATQTVIAEYADSGPEIDAELWLALAGTQWKLGRLEPHVKDQALRVIDERVGLDLCYAECLGRSGGVDRENTWTH